MLTAMLNIQTIYAGTAYADAMSFLYGLMLWRSCPSASGILTLALSFAVRVAGMVVLLAMPQEWPLAGIGLGNVLVVASLVLLLEGFSRFLGQSPPRRVQAFMMSAAMLGWPYLLSAWPNIPALRITLYSFLLIVFCAQMVRIFQRDEALPTALHKVMYAWIGLAVATAITRAYAAWFFPSQDALAPNVVQSIALLFQILTVLFLGLTTAVVVGARGRWELLARIEEERARLLMLSHELRTPLAIVSRSSELLETVDRPSDPAMMQRIRHIRAAVARMNELVTRFLNADRLDEEDEIRERFDLVPELKGLANSPRILLNMPETLVYSADRKVIGIIVSNLIGNALKYAPDDSPVHVSLRKVDGLVQLTVEDRGIGLGTDEERAQLGKKFFRAPNALSTAGMGLGLYTARRLAARYGGIITLEPRDGGGAVATLTLGGGGLGA